MAVEPRYADDVQVLLKTVNSVPGDVSFDRQILLTKNNSRVDIGRSTKRDARLAAKPNNGWFDSPVMSRNHARLFFSSKEHSVFITDSGSLHGTYINNDRLSSGQTRKLASSDVLRFGVQIQKGRDTFQACEMSVSLKYGSYNPEERPLVFKVPDTSDEEDNTSSVDDGVERSVAILKKAGIRVPQLDQTASVSAIDLTGDETLVMQDASHVGHQGFHEDAATNDRLHLEDHSSQRVSAGTEQQEADSKPSTSRRNSNSSIVITREEGVLTFVDGGIDNDVECHDLSEETNADSGHRESSLSSQPTFQAIIGADLDGADDMSKENHLVSELDSSDGSSRCDIIHDEEESYNKNNRHVSENNHLVAVSMSAISRQLPEKTSIGDLPEKSSKAEFFAAREHNRQVHANFRKLESDTQISADHVTRTNDSMNTSNQDRPQTCTTTAALLASGERFLRTPLVNENSLEPARLEDLFDDNTSAYTYEMSEKAAAQRNSGALLSQRDQSVLSDDVVLSTYPVADTRQSSRKRKSDNISTSLANETKEPSSSQTQLNSSQPATQTDVTSPLCPGDTANISSTLTYQPERPVKRLRRVAEFFGYAAIGGVAVMSALIATAPAL